MTFNYRITLMGCEHADEPREHVMSMLRLIGLIRTDQG